MTLLFYALYPFSPHAGGMERWAVVMGRRFEKDGHRVLFVSCAHNQNAATAVEGQLYLKELSRSFSSANKEALHRIILAEDVDIIVNQQGDSGEMTRVADEARIGTKARLVSVLHFAPDHLFKIFRASTLDIIASGLPVVERLKLIVRNSRWRSRQMRRMTERAYSEVYEKSDKVVLLSDRFRDAYCQMASVKDVGDKLLTIPNPYTGDTTNEVPAFSMKEKEVLYVGRLEFRQKRLDMLLRVWKRVSLKFPDWRLTVVGDGDYAQPLRQLSAKWNLQRISFVGQTDPSTYYQRASILCMTSNTEGFGLVLVEAARNRIVPMAFDSYEAVHDIIVDDVTGCLVPAFDLDAYSSKLEMLMSQEDKRKMLADNAYQNSSKFDLDAIALKWYQLFDNLCSTR